MPDRTTFAPFSPGEAAALRSALQAGDPLRCPRCGTAMAADQPLPSAGTVELVWLIRCGECRRGLTVADAARGPAGR